jgi:hypothetical protein
VENPEKALTTSTADEPDVEPCTSTEQGEMVCLLVWSHFL